MRPVAVLDEHEWPAAHYGLGGEIRILGQLGGAVDAVVGQRQRAEEGGVRFLDLHDHGGGIWRRDRHDVGEQLLADGDDAGGRIADAVEGGLHVL